MIKFCVLLLLLAAAVSIQADGLSPIQPEDPPQNGEVKLNDNEATVQLQQKWLKKPGGWSKPKPCGRPGRPPCPTEGTTTTLPPTRPTTKKPITTTGGFVTPSYDEELTTSTTRKPKPTQDSRPTFGTTASTEATHVTAAPTPKTTRRPLPTPKHDDGIVFIDDDDDDHPITKPTPTRTPKPTPNGDVDGEKDTERTPVTPSTTTQPSVTYQACIRKCPVTPEYNPVCGSDGVTYSNFGRLNCARKCGAKVSLVARGPCRSKTTTPSTTSSTTPSNDPKECIRKCPVTPEYNPVCGSDGVTYTNLGRLNCVYNCGKKITVVSLGPCGSTTTSKTPTDSTQSPVVKQCIRNCPVTSEYNPVCGSDGVTYTNPGRLECAQGCGVNVHQLARGPCTQITTTTPTPTTTESAVVRDCIRKCPVTPEYSPVCGTNGVTYNNASHLRCAQACKVDVQLSRLSRCPKPRRPLPIE